MNVPSLLTSLIAAVAVQAAPTPELTLERVAELENGLDVNALLRSGIAGYVPYQPEPIALTEWSRFYSVYERDGEPFILGEYMPALADDDPNLEVFRGRNPSPRGAFIRRPRNVLDGGCSVISVKFDFDTGRPLAISCNGLA